MVTFREAHNQNDTHRGNPAELVRYGTRMPTATDEGTRRVLEKSFQWFSACSRGTVCRSDMSFTRSSAIGVALPLTSDVFARRSEFGSQNSDA